MDDDSSDGTESVSVERRSPDSVFGLLSNELRIEILRALGRSPDAGMSFSDLFDRVDVSDSGNFNYHLNELRGSLVRKDETYELTYAGKQIIGAIYAGTYTANATVEPLSIGWTCLLCGGEMSAEYRDETAIIRCRDCERGASFPFPPGSLDQYARDELPRVFSRWWHHTVKRITDGFCPTCAGRLSGELVRLPDGDGARPSMAEFGCDRCGTHLRVSGATLATIHPVVEGFLTEHGFDTRNRHPSQVWGELDASDVQTLSTDPYRISVQFAVPTEAITAEIGPTATVSNVHRRTRDSEH